MTNPLAGFLNFLRTAGEAIAQLATGRGLVAVDPINDGDAAAGLALVGTILHAALSTWALTRRVPRARRFPTALLFFVALPIGAITFRGPTFLLAGFLSRLVPSLAAPAALFWCRFPLIAAEIVGITVLTYAVRMRGAPGARWPYLALGLRLAAVGLCLLAALRPSLVILDKLTQQAALIFLIDDSASMGLGGEAGGATRFEAARRTLADALVAAKGLGANVVPKAYRFDSRLRDAAPDDKAPPKGRVTALGTALEEAANAQGGKVLRVVVLSDGASNTGRDPRLAAQALRNRGVPIVAVGFGSEAVGTASRDVAVRDLVAGPIVYERTEVEVRGTVRARGYPGKTLDVELLVEGQPAPVARARVPVPEGAAEVPVRGLKWTPTKGGETKVTLRVKPQADELNLANNEYGTFVTVVEGGIGVLYIARGRGGWERRFLTRALDASEKIQLTYLGLNEPAGAELDRELLAGKYNVFLLGDLPAALLTRTQQQILAESVRKGAGLLMLGGRESFGPGGWAGTPVADVLPVSLHPGDPQADPEGGLKVLPNLKAPDNYVLRLAPTMAETVKAWEALPNIPGANRFTAVKPGAQMLAQTADGDPVLAAASVGRGRAMAFGGETWVWARGEESRVAHLNFWRQAILWLAHKEDEGAEQVRLALDRRRVAVGEKLELTATARTAKGEPVPDVKFTATLQPIADAEKGRDRDPAKAKVEAPPKAKEDEAAKGKAADAPAPRGERLELFGTSGEGRAAYIAAGAPGEYLAEVKATRGGQEVGSARARFLVFDDDRELDNPAADLNLLRQVAQIADGKFLAPEQLADHLKGLGKEVVPDYTTQREIRLWDSWPFLLLFAALLTMEWWLRKKNGWV